MICISVLAHCTICLQPDSSSSALKEQLDAAIELYQAEMRLRLEAEERIAKLESTIALQAKEVCAYVSPVCMLCSAISKL